MPLSLSLSEMLIFKVCIMQGHAVEFVFIFLAFEHGVYLFLDHKLVFASVKDAREKKHFQLKIFHEAVHDISLTESCPGVHVYRTG